MEHYTQSPQREIQLFVPGRLCLFGEHSDWAGKYVSQNPDILEGQAIVTGINLGIYASAKADEKFHVKSINQKGESVDFCCNIDAETLRENALKDNFFSYCCGVAAYMVENYHVGGISIEVKKVTLPMKKGLSSSAAICVLIARAFSKLYQLHLSVQGEMRAAYYGERLTQSRCGRLDQACAFGEQPIIMKFSDEEISIKKLKVGKTMHWVFADLCASKDTRKILSHLNRAYPFAQNEMYQNVQDALGKDNYEIIARASQAIEEGDAEALGRIMTEAQRLFDTKIAPACPEELTSPVLHSVLNDPQIQPYIWGAKGVGSQGDGSVQLLAKDKACQQALVDYLNNERKMEAFPFELQAGGKIRKAIIPIAGFGTRMYPQTHFTKKAFLPVIDENEVVKPVLMCIIEELDAAGIEDIILIIGENEIEDYKKLFEYKLDESYLKKLPKNVRDYYHWIYGIGGKITYVVQKEQKGFGHAVYQAHELVKDDPVLLLLGDFIYKSKIAFSCTTQTINAYNKSGGDKAVVSIKTVPLEQVSNYGILSGQFYPERPYLMDVSDIVEKPSAEFAKKRLGIRDEEGKNLYFATFGQYILTKDVFDYLGQQIEENEQREDAAEIDLTGALQHLAGQHKLTAVDIAGESYDVGIPARYYDTFVSYRRPLRTSKTMQDKEPRP